MITGFNEYDGSVIDENDLIEIDNDNQDGSQDRNVSPLFENKDLKINQSMLMIGIILKELNKYMKKYNNQHKRKMSFADRLLQILSQLRNWVVNTPDHWPARSDEYGIINETNMFEIGSEFGCKGEEWSDRGLITKKSFILWRVTIVDIGTRLANCLTETKDVSQRINSQYIPQWCRFLCSVISDRLYWPSSIFRKKSKSLLTTVCASDASKRHNIYDSFVYGRHFETIQAIYQNHQSVGIVIPQPNSKEFDVNGITVYLYDSKSKPFDLKMPPLDNQENELKKQIA